MHSLFSRDRLIKAVFVVVALAILFFSCLIMLKGAGGKTSERSVFLLCTLIIIFNSSKKAFWYMVIPMVCVYAIYTPIGLIFGKPTYQYIASVFATDLMESQEFFLQIPPVNYLLALSVVPGILLYRYITTRFDIQFHRNRTLLCSLILFAMMNQTPAVFFNDLFAASVQVKDELVKVNKMMVEDRWGTSTTESEYDNYILIIGESVRKDYLNAYGYPIPNTPFMSVAKGTLVDGFTSAGTNTISSLRLMLTKSDKEMWTPDYSLNFIDLAKSAGIKTYWLSNQGYIGEYDTPITAIARRSDSTYFIKYGDYASSNTSDFELLKPLTAALESSSDKKKLIVMHLYGSHPSACDRISDYKLITTVKDAQYQYLNCYISSIQKTDDLLRDTWQKLEENYRKTGKTFSMIYFSDHGLAHRELGGEIIFNNNRASKLHYNVPLFNIASDSDERKVCHSFKSGLNFTEALGNWMGIRNTHLAKAYNLFDCRSDADDYGLQRRISSTEGIADPAIDLTGK